MEDAHNELVGSGSADTIKEHHLIQGSGRTTTDYWKVHANKARGVERDTYPKTVTSIVITHP